MDAGFILARHNASLGYWAAAQGMSQQRHLCVEVLFGSKGSGEGFAENKKVPAVMPGR